MRRQSPSPKARRVRKAQGLPLSVAVYLDDYSAVLGCKSPIDRLRAGLVSRLEEERKIVRRTLRPAMLPDRISRERTRPESELVAFDLLDYQEKCEIAARQLDVLHTRCESLQKANTALRQCISLQSVREVWDLPTLSNEIEDLYSLLSSSHASLAVLGKRKEQVADEVGRLRQEAGVMRYSLELTANTKVVKGGLLKEAVAKQLVQRAALCTEVGSLQLECDSLSQEIESLEEANMTLASTCGTLETRGQTDSLHLANLCQSLCVTTALLLYSQAQVSAWEEFILSHTS